MRPGRRRRARGRSWSRGHCGILRYNEHHRGYGSRRIPPGRTPSFSSSSFGGYPFLRRLRTFVLYFPVFSFLLSHHVLYKAWPLAMQGVRSLEGCAGAGTTQVMPSTSQHAMTLWMPRPEGMG